MCGKLVKVILDFLYTMKLVSPKNPESIIHVDTIQCNTIHSSIISYKFIKCGVPPW